MSCDKRKLKWTAIDYDELHDLQLTAINSYELF